MKVVILGGGIAGFCLAIELERRGVDYLVFERSPSLPNLGHAFLIHRKGLSMLSEMCNEKVENIGSKINSFRLFTSKGEMISETSIGSWACIKRYDLVNFLYNKIPKSKVLFNKNFANFEYDNQGNRYARFKDSTCAKGDIFVGADGANSRVRSAAFGRIDFTPVLVKEILGRCVNETLHKHLQGKFTKCVSQNEGLSIGIIPCDNRELIWFMQYDPSILDVQKEDDPEVIHYFCKEKLKDFPDLIQELISERCINNYVWHTKDFDPLPSFHFENIVLVGDAAHLSLPFTSAGTTNAVVDALALAKHLCKTEMHGDAFRAYYEERIDDIRKQVALGRSLRNDFLTSKMSSKPSIPLYNV